MKNKKSISVVMATYNGNEYLQEQLSSILGQLGKNDEVIVIDDCSKDNTLEILKSYNDHRVKIFVNSSNVGVIKSFEIGIVKAQNELIFLSDQDDIWMDNKVSVIMENFINNPSVTLVCSDAVVVDSTCKVLNNSYMNFKNYTKVSFINTIIRNPVLGCTIAFDSKIKSRIMPFPQKIPMHDMWVVLVEFIYGKVVFIDEPLIFYRRHSNNVTSIKRTSWKQVLIWRFNLVASLIGRAIGIL